MLQHDQTTKTESQMVTAQAELSRMEHTNSTLASKMEALKAELKDAQTRENQLKVKITLTSFTGQCFYRLFRTAY